MKFRHFFGSVSGCNVQLFYFLFGSVSGLTESFVWVSRHKKKEHFFLASTVPFDGDNTATHAEAGR